MDLKTKYQGYSSQVLKSYKVFKIFVRFFDQFCNLGSKWLNNQICSLFRTEILIEQLEKGILSKNYTVYLLLLEILEKITNEKLILTIFRFIFGKLPQLKKTITLEDPHADDFNFELAKLSFKAKNQAASMRMQEPMQSHQMFL